MTDLELVERLCTLLSEAVEIVRAQSELLAMHGITGSGALDARRERLLSAADETM
jgi:hypothetical protein